MSRMKFREKEEKYTKVSNNIIFKTKNVELVGIYTTIQTLIKLEINTQGTDDEFMITKKGIQSYCGCKDSKFKKLWDGLKESGYLKQYKIQTESGKFEYEYELLAEPDFTTYHSLIEKKDGTIVPNVPKNKLSNLLKKSCEETRKKIEDKKATSIENTKELPECVLPEAGQTRGYNNKRLNKVCMYVKKTEKYFELKNEHVELIENIKSKMEFNLFEELLLETVNKNKHLNYFIATIQKIAAQNIKTLEMYIEHKKNFIANVIANNKNQSNNTTKESRSNTKSNTAKNNIAKAKTNIKTRFHNINETFTKYAPDQLEIMLKANQKDKFKTSNNNFDSQEKYQTKKLQTEEFVW